MTRYGFAREPESERVASRSDCPVLESAPVALLCGLSDLVCQSELTPILGQAVKNLFPGERSGTSQAGKKYLRAGNHVPASCRRPRGALPPGATEQRARLTWFIGHIWAACELLVRAHRARSSGRSGVFA